MRKLSLILMAIIVSITAYGIGYPQNVIWEKTYGGVNNDLGKSVRQTTDGGFIVVGATWVSDNYDIWLLKLDPNGNIVWEKTYGEGEKDIPYTIRQTDDNGFIILGITASFGTIGQDFLLIKTDSLGNTEWIQTYGGSGYDDGRNVEQTSDKGYILAGFSTSFDSSFDAMLVKTDSLGNMQWYKNYSFSDYLHPFGDYAQHAIQTSDGGYAIASVTCLDTLKSRDWWMIRTDSNGDTLWTRVYQGGGEEESKWIHAKENGHYVIAGRSNTLTNGSEDFCLMEIDEFGEIIWRHTYGGSKGDVGYWAEVTEDKGYVLSGCGTNSWAHPTPFDLMVVRTDSLGNQLWSALYGGEEEEWSRTIHTTSDGGYIAAGWTESYGNGNADIYIVRIGNKLFTAEITAADSVVTVPAGESCYYSTFLKNNTMEQRVTDAWINIILPGGGVYLLENYTELNIQPNAIYSDDSIQLNVPLSAEPGDYTFIGYVGSYPDNIIDSSFFDFTVVAPINDLFCHDNWEIIVKGASENPELVESHVIGIESYPNPFNATTTLQFFLYEENEIAVDIFDLLGRKVVNLATGIYPQGSHQLIWNASDYASGIYFYKLTTNTTSITKRITLLK